MPFEDCSEVFRQTLVDDQRRVDRSAHEAEMRKVLRQRDDLLAALHGIARGLDCMAHKLSVQAPPGHVDYLNKAGAAKWAQTLCGECTAAIARAERGGGR